MKRTVTALLVATVWLAGAGPAVGLSCAPPQPFDVEAAIADADAAAIGTITSISSSTDDDSADAELVLTVEVREVFKGTVRSPLTLERFRSVWGPYYQEGDELALLVTDGEVSDGQDSLCGPFYSADDMRLAGGEPTLPGPPRWNMSDLLQILFDLVAFLMWR